MTMRRLRLAAFGIALGGCVPATSAPSVDAGAAVAPAADSVRVIDDFESPSGWESDPSEGVTLRISVDSGYAGRAMRLDFDFGGGAGYAIARKRIPIDLPVNWEFSFRIRAEAPVNNLEFKLLDPSGENVWWVNRRSYEYPREWERVRVRKRQVEFAWGPKGGGEMDSVAALELVVTAGTGGKGTVWIDDLEFRARPPETAYTGTPVARASTGGAARAIDGDSSTSWRGGAGEWVSADFGAQREFGGLVAVWDRAEHATGYTVETSDDGNRWEPVYRVTGGDGGSDPIPLADSESRFVRLRIDSVAGGREASLRELVVQPVAWTASPNTFFANLATAAPRGAYPRYLTGEQSYWTVVGVNGDTREATINTDGMVETGIGGPSLEPFLLTDGRLVSWADVSASQALADAYLPIPTVAWNAGDLRLTVTTFAAGPREASTAYVRYRVENASPSAKEATLFLALRPFQVNPPWQFLNVQGGVSRVRRIERAASGVEVNGARAVLPMTAPVRFGAFAFDQGDVVEHLRAGGIPASAKEAVDDPRGYASAAMQYPLSLPAGGAREVWVAIPLHESSAVAAAAGDVDAEGERLLAESIRTWREELGRFTLRLPEADNGQRIANTLRSQLAYILINRDGPSIQPGSRSYDRSWIRDGSLTSAALLRLGHPAEVREFAEWYAPHQRANGYVPCCVSLRGADPVPEHDSHGQLIYLLAEYHRHTGDDGFLTRMYPHVERAVAYIDTLRHERMTPEYQTAEKRAFYGLVPQSISHEGYSAKPMHSYWDDFFVMKGLDDAVYAADVLGRTADRARFAAIRDAFRHDLLTSLRLAMAMHDIAYLPGSVELGDFDATSTTVGLVPAALEDSLPRAALQATFERYYRESIRARLDGLPWDGYTPYEWRTVGTFVRLGWRERAHEAISLFFSHQRPQAWNHWAEVVFSDPASPRFIGDMPHTWVGSDFIRSVLDLFAYERDMDGALVIGAGVPESWVRDAPGVEMDGLHTRYGTLRLRMRAEGSNTVRVTVGGGIGVPPGGLVIVSPLDRQIRRVTVNGRAVRVLDPDRVTVRTAPADVVLFY